MYVRHDLPRWGDRTQAASGATRQRLRRRQPIPLVGGPSQWARLYTPAGISVCNFLNGRHVAARPSGRYRLNGRHAEHGTAAAAAPPLATGRTAILARIPDPSVQDRRARSSPRRCRDDASGHRRLSRPRPEPEGDGADRWCCRQPGRREQPAQPGARPHPLRRRVPRHQRPAPHDGPRADRHAGGQPGPQLRLLGRPGALQPDRHGLQRARRRDLRHQSGTGSWACATSRSSIRSSRRGSSKRR